MESIDEKENDIKTTLDEIINLTLEERKEIVKSKIKQSNLSNKELSILLNYDNTNEGLIFMYLNSFKKIDYELVEKYIGVLSLEKIKKLKQTYFPESSYGFRQISFKEYFFKMISFLKEKNKKSLSIICTKIFEYSNNSISPNQPIDFSNFEFLYFYFCDILRIQIKHFENFESPSFNSYLDNISTFLYKLKELEIYNNVNNYKKETENFQKFYTIIFSVLCFDLKNVDNLKQTINIFNPLKKNAQQKLMEFSDDENIRKINEFFNKFKEEDLNNNIVYLEDFSKVEEKYFSYGFISKNNIFCKYENKILSLLNKIFNSNLIKYTCDSIYKKKINKNVKYFFEYTNGIEKFWKKNVIFVPFKLENTSGFTYKDIFKTFVCIYKSTHYRNDVENIIFTLGSTIRILIHECLGHLLIAYLFFRISPKINNENEFYSPRMVDKINSLNIESHPNVSIELNNVILKFKENIENIIEFKMKMKSINLEIKEIKNVIKEIEKNNIEQKEEIYTNYIKPKKKLKKELCEIKDKIVILEEEFEKKLKEKLNEIISVYYSEKLSTKIINNIEDIWNLLNTKKEESKKQIGNKLIEMLFEEIYKEFLEYIKLLDEKGKVYLENESGNVIEFLLFNNFNNEMSLKECLFLINEKNYDENNFFIFRTMYKNLYKINDQLIIKKIVQESEFFKDIVKEYQTIYNKNELSRSVFNEKKKFRNGYENSFNEKKEVKICGNCYLKYQGFLKSKKMSLDSIKDNDKNVDEI